MSDQQQPLSRSQSAYPYGRPLPPQHPPYGTPNGHPLPHPPHLGRVHHHAYTDSALMGGPAAGPSSYPMTPNPAYQPLSYTQPPFSSSAGGPGMVSQQYGGSALQPPPLGPVQSRSDSAIPTMAAGAPQTPPTYWTGSSQPPDSEKIDAPNSYSPPLPNGTQHYPHPHPHRHLSSPTTSSPRQSFGSYQEFASRTLPPPPPIPRKEFTAPAGAPPYCLPTPPAPPPIPPKIEFSTAGPDGQSNGEQQQYQQQSIQSSPTSMPQELAPNQGQNLQPGDDELDRALRLSMESYAAESQRHAPPDEDEEARILRASREEYEREQERNRMLAAAGRDESEEEMMARVMAMSLEEEVNKQMQIERQIQRTSWDSRPGPSGLSSASSSSSSTRQSFDDDDTELPYRSSAGLSHSASTGSSSSSGRPHTPRPHIITSMSTPLGSRSPTPNPSQMHQRQSFHQTPPQSHNQPLNPQSPTSPTSPSSMDMLPRYEEVATPSPQPHSSPVVPTTPGLSSTSSSLPPSSTMESPGLQLPHSMSEPAMSSSPLGLSPIAQMSPPLHNQNPQGSPPQHRARPHSSHAQTLPSPTSSAGGLGGGGGGLHRGNSSPSTGAILNQQAQYQGIPGHQQQQQQQHPVLRNSRSSIQLRPHGGQDDVPPMPPMPVISMPVPTIPGGPPNGEMMGRLSPQPPLPPAAGPPPVAANGPGPSPSPGARRVQIEAEYTNKVSFGYMAPPIDQPVIPPCPPFPETVVIQSDAAFHISAPTWHHLLRLLARLGEVTVIPSPAVYSKLPLNTTAADLRLILHFHKSKVGGEWRVVLWMDYDRALPKSMTPYERGRWTNGDTTLLPYGCRIPEESISGTLRGPGPTDISTSSGNVVYVLQAPFPKLPISLSNVAAILQQAYQKSKDSSSTGVPSSGDGAAQVDRGLSSKRLSKAVDKIYPPSKRGSSVASGVVHRAEASDLVAVGGKRTVGGWLKSGFGRMVGTKEEKGGQWKNEEELADLVTPFSLDERR